MTETESWKSNLVRDFSRLSKSLENADSRGLRGIFKDQLSVGGGENFSAEEHRGREVLELFQNAADKCQYTGMYESGTVYIAFTEEGLLVANTGENFDFSEEETENALSIFGYTDKDESDVGKFGVGLTAIRASGEAYEVWTKAEAGDEDGTVEPMPTDCWRVRCGPENILAPIAHSKNASNAGPTPDPVQDLCDEIEDETGETDLLPDPDATPSDLEFDLSPEEFPYFLRPLPRQDWQTYVEEREDLTHLERRAHQLLTGDWHSSSGYSIPEAVEESLEHAGVGAFTTTVFVEYENEAWRTLFNDLSDEQLSEPADPHLLHDQAWNNDSGDTKLTPELLLLLSDAETVIVESCLTGADGSEYQIWDIDPPGADADSKSQSIESAAELATVDGDGIDSSRETESESVEIELTEVAATIKKGIGAESSDEEQQNRFWHVTFADGRTFDEVPLFQNAASEGGDSPLVDSSIAAQLLVPKLGSEREYRPHLYYPISGLPATFWACPHAEFAVQQDRQSLDGNATLQNACVVAELARLTGGAAEALAATDAVDDRLAARIPWRLLPAKPSAKADARPPCELVDDDIGVGQADIVASLQAAMATRMRTARVIPAVSGRRPIIDPTAPNPIGLPDDLKLVAGLAALYELDITVDADQLFTCAEDVPIDLVCKPAMARLAAWLSNPADGLSKDATNNNRPDDTDWPQFSRSQIVDGGDRLNRVSYFLATTDETDKRLPQRVWQSLLTKWAARYRETSKAASQAALEVRQPVGDAIIDATMALATPDGESGPEAENLNNFVLSDGSGAYLLPCRVSSNGDHDVDVVSNTEQSVFLVYAENHSGRASSTRVVLRPGEDTEGNIDLASVATEFDIYVLTDRTFNKYESGIKQADWGTTEYTGPLELFRSQLKTTADAGIPLDRDGLTALATQFDEIENKPSSSPGAFHSEELVETIVTARNGDDVDERYKTLLDARRIQLAPSLLSVSRSVAGRDVQFDDDGIKAHDGLPDELNKHMPIADGPQATTASMRDGSNFKADNLSETLTMLGVSPLPGIETIARYRDIGLSTSHSWHPVGADSWGDPGSEENRVDNLQDALCDSARSLSGAPDTELPLYCELLTAPGFNPSTSIKHTSNCNVKNYLADTTKTIKDSKIRTLLATWVWMRPGTLSTITPAELVPVLQHIGDSLAETVFSTGWHCSFGQGSPSGINQEVPTLLSWQLRCLSSWDTAETLEFHEPDLDTEEEGAGWTRPDSGWTLTYAVQDDQPDDATRRAIDLLPTVVPEDAAGPADSAGNKSLSSATLNGLGVKDIEALTAAEAALRLQAVLGAYTHVSGNVSVLFNGQIPQGWQTLCEKLFEPVVAAVADTGREISELFPYLTHVPVQGLDDGSKAWFALPVEQLSESVVWYKSEASAWESRVEDLDTLDADQTWYLLNRAPANSKLEGLDKFAEIHDVRPKQKQYPMIDASEPTTQTDSLWSELRDFDYKSNIIAAAPGQTTEQIENRESRYDAAIKSLRVPERGTSGFSSNRDWVYQPIDDAAASDTGITIQLGDADGEDEQVWPVIRSDISSDELPALAAMFEALFDGGRIDSYKLALTGQDVEGVDEIRKMLASRSYESLRQDLGQVARLLNIDVDINLDERAAGDYTELRQVCSDCLHPTRTATWPDEDDATEPVDSVIAITEQCDADSLLRTFSAEWLKHGQQHDCTSILWDVLQGHPESPTDDWKSRFIKHVDDRIDIEPFLPDIDPRFRRFVTLLSAISTESALETVPAVDGSWNWHDQVTLDIEGEIHDEIRALAGYPEAIPDTWFELAWIATEGEQNLLTPDVVNSELYEAFATALADHIAGDSDGAADDIKQTVYRRIGNSTDDPNSGPASSESDVELQKRIENAPSDTLGEVGTLSASSGTDSMRASRRSDNGGSLSNSTTVAPRVAELMALQAVYSDIQAGLTSDDIDIARDELKTDDYLWHYDSTWEALPESLPPIDMIESPVGSYLHTFCDTAGEPIVGFDVLDLTGTLVPENESGSNAENIATVETTVYPEGVNPVPVEVKSVNNASQPRFRFTTNQVRRALRFVSDETETPRRPFVLLFIELTENEDRYSIRASSTRVLQQTTDVYDVLGIDYSDDDAVKELLTELVRSGHFHITK